MSAPAFRLLDARTGWDSRPGGLDDVTTDAGTVMLRRLPGTPAPGTPRPLPQALAWSCDDCTWWLGGRSGLRRLGVCDDEFQPWVVHRPVRSVAVGDGLVVVLLANGRGTVQVLDVVNGHLVGEADVARAVTVGLTDAGVVVADQDGRLTHLDPSGLVCEVVESCLPHEIALPRPPWPEGDPPTAVAELDATPRPPTYETTGQLLTEPLDSGIPGCRWHRLRVDAEVPAGTSVAVAVATTDGDPDGHEPHPTDWYDAGSALGDVLLQTPPGRWAFVRVRLTGDGVVSPTVHRIRLDLPRRTGLDDLPAVYAEDPRARDFGERFVSLFDAFLDEMDLAIDGRAALLDAKALPDDALGWLGGLIGVGFEAEMPASRRRDLIAAAPGLYRRRGTPAGLRDTLRIALGIDVTLEELGRDRPWGAVGTARLGDVRLFGRSTARFRLGTSQLGRAPMVSDGDPDLDAVRSGEHKLRVHVPTLDEDGRRVDRALVTRVVRSQAPAHLAVSVAQARPGMTAVAMRLGIDTVLLPPGPAVLGAAVPGAGPTVLGRAVVARGRSRTRVRPALRTE
ncbi:phage tail protein [Terrabacter sp. RAF57]|uniref:phage tail protein n=1 Tax=Terrabacter sp. RAF57 TaxID=3233063 RepID=UPI003F95927A